jgi:hypothetical protein
MAETCDDLAAGGKVNLWGTVPNVCQIRRGGRSRPRLATVQLALR